MSVLDFLQIIFTIRGPLNSSTDVDICIIIVIIKYFMKVCQTSLLFTSFFPSLFQCLTRVFTIEMVDINKNSMYEDYIHSNLLFLEQKRLCKFGWFFFFFVMAHFLSQKKFPELFLFTFTNLITVPFSS